MLNVFHLFDARRYLAYKEYRFESWCSSLPAFHDDDLSFRRHFAVFFTLILPGGDLSPERW
ncbi:hypothetical protein D5F24_01515 [Shigella flexneri]|nr:hypothetical protein [Shigella flexneri]OUZ62335.1 hypothetical protein CBL27_01960 [Shigella sonnei]EAA1380445.1 hypothetical protein [Shigella flexneri]EAA2900882.1 hypothetical protein [Shigella flexneri]EAA2905127.1 hypothetical protein [Shigella flexneri]